MAVGCVAVWLVLLCGLVARAVTVLVYRARASTQKVREISLDGL